MSDGVTASAAQAVVADAKTKSPKKKVSKAGAGPKKAMDHPKYSEMVKQALASLKERGGSSRQAVLKYIVKNFKVGSDENVVNTHLKMALRAGVKNASLKQSKGSGAAGSFRLGEEAKKKPAKAAGAKKAKKPKSPAKAKKPAAAKAKTAKSPAAKMAKKAVATKKPKAAAAPKKAKADKPKKAAATPKKAKSAPAKKSPVKKAKAATKKAPAAKPKKVAAAAKKPAAAAKKS